jgi:hypothetical protein
MLRALVSAAISFCVRASSRPSDGGGAKCSAVEIADDRNDAVRAQLRDFLDAASQSVQPYLGMEQTGRAQRNVATADQQYTDHVLATRAFRIGAS